jgi:hypothetical protein
MKYDKIVLIAYHIFGSSTYAYIEWLVNELKMTANKTEHKNAHLVMFHADAMTPQAK